MRHETVTIQKPGFDFKAAGYLISILSVLLLGAAAWPKAGDPSWLLPVLLGGMGLSMMGMGLRYIAHLKQKQELKKVEAEAVQR